MNNDDPRLFTTCGVCSLPFSEREWEDRHSLPDGEDCHERCCHECIKSNAESYSKQIENEKMNQKRNI